VSVSIGCLCRTREDAAPFAHALYIKHARSCQPCYSAHIASRPIPNMYSCPDGQIIWDCIEARVQSFQLTCRVHGALAILNLADALYQASEDSATAHVLRTILALPEVKKFREDGV